METSLKSLKKAIEDIAVQNPSGFTVDKKTLEPITKGYAIDVSETMFCNGDIGLDAVLNESKKSYIDAIKYTWLKSVLFWDAVIVVEDINIAGKIAYINKSNITDLSTGELIMIDLG